MSNRSKILIIVLLIIIVSVGIFLFLKDKFVFFNNELNVNQEEPGKKPDEEIIIPAIDKETKVKLELERIASIFVERYGSYSNQSDYENITELKPFMTRQMQSWADDFVKKVKMEQDPAQPYHGFSTKALNSEIESSSSRQAAVKVNCQRQEFTDDVLTDKVYYQEAKIIFLEEDGDWKVAQIKWE